MRAARPRGEWWLRAACRDRPDLNFFPDSSEDQTEAKKVCATCPVKGACLEDALNWSSADDHGIRGGTSERQRRRIRTERERRRAS